MKQRICQGIMIIFVLVFLVFVNTNVKTVKANSITNATFYTIGTNASGSFTENGDEHQYYQFTLSESGKIQISGTAYMEWIYLYLYDSSADELWHVNPHWNSTSELITIGEEIYLTSGTYYFCVNRDGNRYGNYNFNINFTSSNESFLETNGGTNNSIDTASTILVDEASYNAQLAQNDEKDFWKFTLTQSGKVNFNATFYNMEWVDWRLYDESGVELVSENPSWNQTTTNITVNEDLFLTAGTYYLCVSKDGERYGKYAFYLSFTSSNETYGEANGGTNNVIENASKLELGNTYNGELAINDDKDFYQFSVSSSGSFVVSVNSPVEWLYIKLYDTTGEEIWSDNPNRDSITNRITYSKNIVLEKGNYYVAIAKDGNREGNYTLSVAKLTKANCSHEKYDSVWKDATYFSKGYRQYTCRDCAYTYKADYTAARKLSQGYLYSYCTTGNGSLNLYWSTITDASGYQIRYSTNKSMKSGVTVKAITGNDKTKKTIKKLSRKRKYYVQVRAYKKSGAKTVYGSWSQKRVLKMK